MIWTEALLAPTVPSLPSPKKTARTPGGSVRKLASTARLVRLTSSTIPTVKRGFGAPLASSSKTAFTMAGGNSFEASPVPPHPPREARLRRAARELVEDRLPHGGRELLRGEPVAPAENPRHARDRAR